ncbi:DUF21 domain-containing protein [Nocardioidaceae bacterium]|nr:DUF21 domain-containing protein [Nocardioidaceae bacterium]
MDVLLEIVLPLLGGLAVIALIIAANGYFVAQEFAYMAVDRSGLKRRAGDGDTTAQRTLKITERTSFMLSGAQLGITVTGLLVGYVAQPLVGDAIGELLEDVGVPVALGATIGTLGILVVATFVQMLFGELYPKNLALATPYPVASRLARSTSIYMSIMKYPITFFDASSNALLRLLGTEPVHDVAHSANAADLQRIVTLSEEAGELPEELSLVLDRMLDFPTRRVDHALRPRSVVDTVPASLGLEELLAEMEGGHSRYPVLDETGGVVGVVHVIDALRARVEDREVTAADLARTATVVPTLMTLPRALAEMEASSDQMCIVLDEWGGFSGIVTVEDLVEEVVGELTDEHDPVEDPHLEVDGEDHAGAGGAESAPPSRWTVRGDAPLDEVEREIGYKLPAGAAQTVGGMAVAAYGALLAAGEHVDVRLPDDPAELAHDDDPPTRTLRVEVLEVERHVPSEVRLTLVVPEGVAEADLDPPLSPTSVDPATRFAEAPRQQPTTTTGDRRQAQHDEQHDEQHDKEEDH